MTTVYLDNGATTEVDPEVTKLVDQFNSVDYGNASSIHHKGQESRIELEKARTSIANSINAEDEEIVFTSGGTESNNFAIKGLAFANKENGNHIITTAVEHDCVLNSCKWLETQGFEVTYLDVDEEGFVKPEDLERAITKKTILFSVLHGNNEVGTIQNLEELYEVCKRKGIYLHTDACQSYTKTEVIAKHADLITFNAHKIHGPKGVGALFIKKGTKITPFLHGGAHEGELRAGTENIPGIVGFAKAAKLGMKEEHVKKMTELRDYFIEEILKIPDSTLNGPRGNKRLCNNVNVSFKFIEGESIVMYLGLNGICASTGSACSSHTLEPSHVLMAIEDNAERAHSSTRFTLSRFTTKKEIDFTLEKLGIIVRELRKISPLENVLEKTL